MKKYMMTLAALLAASNVMAASAPAAEKPPIMVLTTVDFSGEQPKPLASTSYSLAAKNIQLCWEVVNAPLMIQNNVVEIFSTPAQAVFNSQGSEVEVSKDKKQYTLKTMLPATAAGTVSRCWTFDKTDPIGKYTLELKVNDIVFQKQQFEIVK